MRLSLYARGRTCLAWLPSQTATMFTSTTSPVSSQDTQCRAVTTKLHEHINNQPFCSKETLPRTKYQRWTLPLKVPLSDNYRTQIFFVLLENSSGLQYMTAYGTLPIIENVRPNKNYRPKKEYRTCLSDCTKLISNELNFIRRYTHGL